MLYDSSRNKAASNESSAPTAVVLEVEDSSYPTAEPVQVNQSSSPRRAHERANPPTHSKPSKYQPQPMYKIRELINNPYEAGGHVPECISAPRMCIVFCIALAALAIGMPMYQVATDNKDFFDTYPPEEVFESRQCVVDSFNVTSDTRDTCCGDCDSTCYECYDIFKYNFHEVTQSGKRVNSKQWESALWEVRRDSKKCKESRKPVSDPHFQEEQQTGCWLFTTLEQLTVSTSDGCIKLKEGTGACIPGIPACGNPECFVINDPVKLAWERSITNNRLFIAGTFFLVMIGVVLCVGSWIMYKIL